MSGSVRGVPLCLLPKERKAEGPLVTASVRSDGLSGPLIAARCVLLLLSFFLVGIMVRALLPSASSSGEAASNHTPGGSSRRASSASHSSPEHCPGLPRHGSSSSSPACSSPLGLCTSSDFLARSNGESALHPPDDEDAEDTSLRRSSSSAPPTSLGENLQEDEEEQRRKEQRMHALARLLVHVDPKFRNKGLKRVENFLAGKSLSMRARKRHKNLSSGDIPLSGHSLSRKRSEESEETEDSRSSSNNHSSSPSPADSGARGARGGAASAFSLPLSQFEKVWSTLYYAAWLSDKPLIQRDLFVRLALLQRVLPAYAEKRKFFKAFFLTLKRGWDRLDHIRMNKFLLLERIMIAELTSVMLSSVRGRASSKVKRSSARLLLLAAQRSLSSVF